MAKEWKGVREWRDGEEMKGCRERKDGEGKEANVEGLSGLPGARICRGERMSSKRGRGQAVKARRCGQIFERSCNRRILTL